MGLAVRIAVCGGSEPAAEQLPLAEEVGARIAAAGAILICGGLGGVMEAAARGAATRGGISIGVLPGYEDHEANHYITIPLPTGLGEARNVLVVTTAHAVIAVGGEWGTISEVAFAMKIGRPVILLEPQLGRGLPVEVAASPADAVRRALDAAERTRGSARHAR